MPNARAPMEKPDLPEAYEKEYTEADMEILSQRLIDKYGTDNPAELKSRIVQRGLQEMQKKEGRPGMKDGGMAKGKGGKSYQHNYATGGSVTDHLSASRGHPANRQGPISVQAMTAQYVSPLDATKRKKYGA